MTKKKINPVYPKARAAGQSPTVSTQPAPSVRRRVPSESVASYQWLKAFDHLKDPIFVHDKQLRILHCNAAYAERAGQPLEALIGKPYWQIFPKVLGPPGIDVEAPGKDLNEERSEIATDAGEIFMTYDITAYRASGEFWYAGHLMENITARKQDEDTEKLKSEFLDAVIGGAPETFFVLDRNLNIVRCNAGLNRLTGLSNAELEGRSILSLIDEGDRERISAKVEEAFSTGFSQNNIRLQSSYPNQGNRDYGFSAQRFELNKVPYVVVICFDKTELKRLESDLIREKMISDEIIDSAPGTFFMIDQQTNLVRWNQGLCKESGLSDQQLRGSSILSIIYEPDRPLAAAKFLVALATGYAQMEVRVQTPDQKIRHFLKTARRLMVDGVPYLAGYCIDVTERKQLDDALAKEKAFSDALIESVPGVFYVVDQEGNYFRWNAYLNRLTGLSDAQLRHRTWLLTVQDQDRPLAAATMKTAFEQGYAQAELHVLTCDQGIRLYLMTARRFQVADASYLVGVGIDTTDRLAKETALEHSAHTDALTHIANRGHFLAMAAQEFARCRRYGHPLSVWMIDIDHFKAVNDTYGHPAGDTVLQSLVQTSRKALRDWDILGRMGGEEFAVLLPETDSHQSLLIAERLRQMVATTEVNLNPEQSVHIAVSIGTATAAGNDASLEALLSRADQALFEAKQTGRDKVCVAEHSKLT